MSASSPTCCLGGYDGPLQQAAIKCFYPHAMLFPHVLSVAICWGTGKGSAGGVQTPWPSLTWPGGQHGKCCCCCTPVLITPQGPDILCSSHMALEGSRMGPEGRPAAPATMEPPCLGPRDSSPGPSWWPWQSSSCHSNHGGCHCRCPPWGQRGSQLGQEGRGFISINQSKPNPSSYFFPFLSS